MNENIKALLEKITGDEKLLAKFSACGSVDEAYELAKGIVGGFTKEEFLEAAKALSTAANGEISDEDLADVAGGLDDFDRNRVVDFPKITDKSLKSIDLPEITDKSYHSIDIPDLPEFTNKSENSMSQITRTKKTVESKASKALAV